MYNIYIKYACLISLQQLGSVVKTNILKCEIFDIIRIMCINNSNIISYHIAYGIYRPFDNSFPILNLL